MKLLLGKPLDLVRDYLRQSIRRGPKFRRLLRELQRTETLAEDEMLEWQTQKLRGLLCDCASNVPYYREIFARLSMDPSHVDPMVILENLPLLTKEEVRRNPESFLNRRFHHWMLKKAYTSGTTGTPLVCYRDMHSINFEHAMIWRQRLWSGYSFADARATLRGDLVVPATQQFPPFWKWNGAEQQLLMSSYHMRADTVPSYLDAIGNHKIAAIEGYPSSVYLLAYWIHGSTVERLPMKAVFTSSETLLAPQKALIERVFECPIFDLYGNTERTAILREPRPQELANMGDIMSFPTTEFGN
jgi:phenylacetate-CoA ligase